MVAEVKKYTFIAYHKDYHDLLERLRAKGVVHIVRKTEFVECKAVEGDMDLLKRFKKAAKDLNKIAPDTTPSEPRGEIEEALAGLELKLKEIEEKSQRLDMLRQEAEKAGPWGDFDPLTINNLRNEGWIISLFSCKTSNFQERWEKEYTLNKISRSRGTINFIIIHSEGDLPVVDAVQEKLPERSIEKVNAEIAECMRERSMAEAWIKENAPSLLAAIDKGTDDTINRIEYLGTAEQAEISVEGTLFILEGWVPVSEEAKVREAIGDTDCYAIVSEPVANDKIPVILKNNRFTTLFEPIAKLFALPSYRELDLTPFFAPFFLMFFGFCLGDAGYGLLFLIAGFFIRRKVKLEYRPIIRLAQYFGAATVLFGLLSGTFFGINLIDSGYTITQNSIVSMRKEGVPENIINSLYEIKDQKFKTREGFNREGRRLIGVDEYAAYKKEIIRGAESDIAFLGFIRSYMLESMNMFYLAMMIGGLQILFGMILKVVNIIRMKGLKYSISTMGWVLLAITLIVFKGGGAINLVNEEKLKTLFIVLLAASAGMIFLFNNPDLNVFGRIGTGLWDSYSMVTGVFGDVLSYIRLFALGISSSILGFVFNQIALQMLSVPYLGWLFFLLLLIFGHTLNITISTLGSFVHPMRLTFVEFYKNAGFTGGGMEYKPFRIKNRYL